MLSRTLIMAFWVIYDHLGKLLLANLLCTLLLALPAALGYAALRSGAPGALLMVGAPVLFLALGIILPVFGAALAHMVRVLIDTRDGSFGLLFEGLRRYGLRALGLGAAYSFAAACLGASVWFYAVRLGGSMPWLGYGLSALALWALLLLVASAALALPALVQKNAGVFATMKLAVLLVLANPLFSFGLILYGMVLAAFWIAPPLALFFSVAPLIVLLMSGYEMLSRKYAAASMAAELMKLGPLERNERIFNDKEDDYLNRGFRDFLFPWKG